MKQTGWEKIGIGMYTVHKEAEKNMPETFLKLKKMGYEAIEFYGEPEYEEAMVKRALREADLTLSGWHIEWKNLKQDNLKRTAEYLNRVNCPIAVIPCLGGKWKVAHGPEEESKEIWYSYIEQINEICEKLEREGIRTGYHNHEHEFLLSYDGKKVFDLLFDGLPEKVIIEFDSGNCIEAGENPMRILQKYKKRDMILHLKPFSEFKGFNTILGAEDDLNDWEELLRPENKEYLWLLVESENTKLPEEENAKLCMEGLQKILQKITG